MKYFVFILMLISGAAYGQTTYYIRADSTRLQKVGGSNELIIENDTRDSLGVLVNIGKGRTAFQRGRANGDTLFLGRDTIIGVGAGGGLGIGVITPDPITANTNNYNPTGFTSSITTIRISSDATWNITGLDGGTEGRIVILQNVGAEDIVLTAEDAGSDADNQFLIPYYLEGSIGVVALKYDGTLEKWVPLTSPFMFGFDDQIDIAGGRLFNSNNSPFEIFNFESLKLRLEDELGNDSTAGVEIGRDITDVPSVQQYAILSPIGSGRIYIDPTIVQLQTNNTGNTLYGDIYVKKDSVILYAKDYGPTTPVSSYIKLDPTHAHIYGDSSWTEWSNDEGIEEYPWLGRYRIDSLQEHLASDTVDLKLMFWKYDTDPDESGVVYQMNLQDFIALLPGGSGMANPMTATGDIIYSSDGSGTPARLGIGTSGQVLAVSAGGIPEWVAAASGGVPAGNFGNIQLNRNSAFATPASDSLDYEAATGLVVVNQISATGDVNITNGNLDIITPGQYIGTTSAVTTRFASQAVQAMRIDSTTRAVVIGRETGGFAGGAEAAGNGGLLTIFNSGTNSFPRLYFQSGSTGSLSTDGFQLGINTTADLNAYIYNRENGALLFATNGTTERWRISAAGNLSNTAGNGTAYLHLKAGTATANTAPIKLTSGTLNTTAEAGAIEFLTDKYYATITTGAARKEITLNDAALTSGTVPVATTNGRLTDGFVYTATTTYTPTLTNGANVSGTNAYATWYYRIGNTVHVWGEFDVSPTAAATLTVIGMSLPVSSTITNTYDLAGTAAFSDGTVFKISGDVANARALLQSTVTTNNADQKVSFHFTYKYTTP